MDGPLSASRHPAWPGHGPGHAARGFGGTGAMNHAIAGRRQIAMTLGDILLLARTLAAARGVKLVTVSRWVTGGSNPTLFDRIARGYGCHPSTRRRAEVLFAAHWPRHVEWPLPTPPQTLPEPRQRRKGARYPRRLL